MIYLSRTSKRNVTIAIQLDESFVPTVLDAIDKIASTKLDLSLVQMKFDNSKARLITDNSYRPSVAVMDWFHYGVEVRKIEPTEEFWLYPKPDLVFLNIIGSTISFDFKLLTHPDGCAMLYGTYLDISVFK